MNEALTRRIQRWQRGAWISGLVGLLICSVALFTAPPLAFRAYWTAWIFWSGIGFGSLAMLMLHNLSGGAWGAAVRRPAEAAAMTLPLMALLLIPPLFGLGHIFPWMQPTAFAGHEWPHKQVYLSAPWFIVRGFGYLIVLGGWTLLLGLWKRQRKSRAGAANAPGNPVALSAGGLLVYGFLMLFASTDWVLSLEPQWYSTMFIVIFVIDHFLTALAFVIVIVTWLTRDEAPLTTKQLHDLGNLLLAFVSFWAYITFSQFLIIWSGNLPREISWYLHRSTGAWPKVAVCLVVFQFAVPFALLLSRTTKRHARTLAPIAALVFAANAVHIWWLIAPSFPSEGMRFPGLEIAAFVGIGGVWLATFLALLKRRWAETLPATMEVTRG